MGEGAPDLVGYEWEEAKEHSADLGLQVVMKVIHTPTSTKNSSLGPLRVVRQVVTDKGEYHLTCAYEDWAAR